MLSRRGFLARMLCATAVVPVLGPFSMLDERAALIPGATLRDPQWIADLMFRNEVMAVDRDTAWAESYRTLAIDFERSTFRDEATRQRLMEIEAQRLETWTAFKMPDGTTVHDVDFIDQELGTDGDQLVTIHKSDKPAHYRVQPHKHVEFVFEELNA